MLSTENLKWCTEFQNKYGRRPKVLHVGNIANNAYNNAKLLIEAGFECDVVCYDYYHTMGTPEWEDADLLKTVDDDFAPDWRSVCAPNYRRPEWFVQGPLSLCISYLLVKNGSNDGDVRSLWRGLAHFNKCAVDDTFVPNSSLLTLLLGKTVGGQFVTLRIFLIESAKGFVSKGVRFLRLLSGDANALKYRIESLADLFMPSNRFAKNGFLGFLLTALVILRQPMKLLKAVWNACKVLPFANSRNSPMVRQKLSDAANLYAAEFADREDLLRVQDILAYEGVLERWAKVFASYDFIIAYSTDPILPMLCGEDYFAFEHGTIRDIPYANDATGRLTALAYRLARHVFVTNFDCKSSADYLAPGRYTLLNHPYDEDHGLQVDGADQLREALCDELDCSLLFFHPTRQDWVQGTGYADKNNDVFLHAFAALRQKGIRVGMICCEWGSNVEQSKVLLRSLSCSQHVKWIPPQAITPFERYCKASDVVVDQFKLGAFGGVVFKAMAVGTPIMTYLDIERLSAQYPVPPPVINCRTQDEIVVAVVDIFGAPEKLERVGDASRVWMKQFHSKWQTVNAQVDQFRMVFPSAG